MVAYALACAVAAAPASASVTPGPLLAFGLGADGELGNGAFNNSPSPVSVPGLSNVIATSGGTAFNLALEADGTVWAWGANGQNQLGDGSTTSSDQPEQVVGLSDVIAIAAGNEHSLALESNGTVWAWGYNGYGELGDGTYTNSAVPVEVSGLTHVVAVAAGGLHSLALESAGTVVAWGANYDGQLGNGTTTASDVPTAVSNSLANVVSIAAGSVHSLAVRSDGTVWAWGYNGDGELGNGSTTDSLTPVEVSGISHATSVAGGAYASMALTSGGVAYAWGYGGFGQLGDGSFANSTTAVEVTAGALLTSIAMGAQHAMGIDAGGNLWTWGTNADGQLGFPGVSSYDTPHEQGSVAGLVASGPLSDDTLIVGAPYASIGTANITFPNTDVGSVSTAKETSIYNSGSAPLTISAVVIGQSTYGTSTDQFKLSSDTCTGTTLAPGTSCYVRVRYAPTDAGYAIAGLDVTSNGLDSETFAYLTGAGLPGATTGLYFPGRGGEVFATGDNATGQLGLGTTNNVSTPVPVSRQPASLLISSGPDDTFAVTRDGRLWAWGSNSAGQLGTGNGSQFDTPQQLPIAAGIVAAAAGGDESTALSSDSREFYWPDYYSTDPIDASSFIPPAVAIAAGGEQRLELGPDGTVTAWGFNNYGELGPNDTTAYFTYTPQKVTGIPDAIAIAAGGGSSYALGDDGTVWAWGENDLGQLGNGSETQSSTPTQVSGLSNVIAISAGNKFALALESNGTVWAWGDNEAGELGGQSGSYWPLPVEVSNLSNVVAISAGAAHAVALESDGTAWAWGDNTYGELGIGNTTNQSTPVQITSMNHGVAGLGGGPESNSTFLIAQSHVALSATLLNFGSEPVKQPSLSQTETVTNDGAMSLPISAVKIIGSDGDEFTVSGDGCSGQTIAPGGSCQVGIRFDPKVAGTPVAQLRILSNSPTSPDIVTLDPHAYAAAKFAPVRRRHRRIACARAHVKLHLVAVRCTLSSAAAGKLRVRATVSRAGHVYASRTVHSGSRTIKLAVELPVRLASGRYTLKIAVRGGRSSATQRLAIG